MIKIEGLNKRIVGLVLINIIIGLIGVLDFLSGYEISFALFYLVPISISSLIKV